MNIKMNICTFSYLVFITQEIQTRLKDVLKVPYQREFHVQEWKEKCVLFCVITNEAEETQHTIMSVRTRRVSGADF